MLEQRPCAHCNPEYRSSSDSEVGLVRRIVELMGISTVATRFVLIYAGSSIGETDVGGPVISRGTDGSMRINGSAALRDGQKH